MSVEPPARDDAAPRPTLTDWLRGRSDRELAELLRARPDLAVPLPSDLAAVAGRLGVRTSVQRAVDALDAFTLRVLEALVLAADARDDVDPEAAARLLDGLPADPAIDTLLARGLIWGEAPALRLVPSAREAVGTYPAGLGRPAALLFRTVADVQLRPVLAALGLPPGQQPASGIAVAERVGDPDWLRDQLAALVPDERALLERLAAGPPAGTVRRAQLAVVTGETSVTHRLISRALLVAIDAQTVELPREVGIALRPHPLGRVSPEPPRYEPVQRDPQELDRIATTAVLDLLRRVEALADSWTAQPPALLRAGGVGVRELRRTARTLGLDEATTAVVIEVAYAAGLINSTNTVEPVFLPTPEYDAWRSREPAARWVPLATAWLAMTRQPMLVNQRGDRERLINVLSPDAERGTGPALRRQVLDTLLALPPGGAPPNREAVLDQLAWFAPRRAAGQRAMAMAVLEEADLLGLTAAGGPTGFGRTLLAAPPASGATAAAAQESALAALASALPVPVDEFVVQPDLTVVVPGPPTAPVAAELDLLADLESTGGAHVYRITEASVRRAFDAGRQAADLLDFVGMRSRTPVPQALTYLIEDAARRHGVLRTGAASAYLRSDDEAVLARVVADRSTAALDLRLLAPTVAISTAPVNRVLEVLRAAGYAPAAEAADGFVVALDAEPARSPSRPAPRPLRTTGPAESDAQLAETVRRIRSGDALSSMSRRVPAAAANIPGVTSAATMELLRKAVRESRRVDIGLALPDGSISQHTVRPISLGGGVVRGYEQGHAGLVSYAVHRLTAVMLSPDDDIDDDPETPA
ncbi:MAG: helicase-associated domain-containing protein [Jatrophihabitans sp.]|uniref:helicase-associated domain-containing protein n=1 Tax=Jatrophihabitans sp. TaxID=1932789 RepID=UPI003F8197D2